MSEAEDRMNAIVSALKSKAGLKQQIYRSTKEVFAQLKGICKDIAAQLTQRVTSEDPSVTISYKDINEFEFHLQFSGDMLIFTMHSNIVTFPPEHHLTKLPYVAENPDRGFFGHIMVYNFMADTIRYNRLQDPGYLLARLLLNAEGHFYVEGVRQLSFLYPSLAQNVINPEMLKLLVEQVMEIAIETDLIAPVYQDIQVVSLGEKYARQMVGGGTKVGFQMRSNSQPGIEG
jgi:hypothetical protein